MHPKEYLTDPLKESPKPEITQNGSTSPQKPGEQQNVNRVETLKRIQIIRALHKTPTSPPCKKRRVVEKNTTRGYELERHHPPNKIGPLKRSRGFIPTSPQVAIPYRYGLKEWTHFTRGPEKPQDLTPRRKKQRPGTSPQIVTKLN